ncbi:MAG TPA: DNA polymerase III subunit delta [Candidatus Binatia bacterium]
MATAKRDLAALLADLKSDQAARLLLVFGDDLQVQESCKAIVDLIVPQDRRGFNLERFDGRSTSWDQIEASLQTPPFFPGKKLLWVDNAPYFFSREQKGEVSEKILDLWRDGKRDDAVKLLIDLVVLEGWTQDQWEQLDGASSKALMALLDAQGGEVQEEAEALIGYAKSRDVDLGKRKSAEGHRLVHLLDGNVPEWSFLLLTAMQVDRRTRLYKRFEETGAVLFLGLERDRSGKISRESLLEFVSQWSRQIGKTIDPQAREMILARAGDDLRGLRQELDKLGLFVGERPTIQAVDVATIFADHGEGWIFDLTRAIGERDALGALSQLSRLLAQGEHPLRLLGTLASELRRLLSARQLLETDLARTWKRGMTYQQFQHSVLKQGTPLLTRNPYGDYMCFQRAEGFSLADLRSYMEGLFDADFRLKSSGGQPSLVMEKLILSMCLGGQRNRRSKQVRTSA